MDKMQDFTRSSSQDQHQDLTGVYVLQLADNALILAQRNSEWTGHGPVLEQDIAITNISLDLLGQARNFYQYAAGTYNNGRPGAKEAFEPYLPRPWKAYHRELNEDDLAFLRDENQYLNVQLVELPKRDWAFTVLRQFLFSTYQDLLFQQLQQSVDHQLAAIAEKSIKEVAYHLRWSSEWVVRLGDGTRESHQRMKNALENLWPYCGEFFRAAKYEQHIAVSKIGPDVSQLETAWSKKIQSVFEEARLALPESSPSMHFNGKEGRHTEHMGYLLTEMQYLQRTYPNVNW